jgi:hypothetical protein
MRALIIFTVVLLNQLSYAQDSKATAATPATTAPAQAEPVATQPAAVETQEEEAEPAKEPMKTGFVINPNFTLASRKLEQESQPQGKMREARLDTKVGYVFDFGLFAGAQLNYATGSLSGPASTQDADTTSYLAGPTLGYSCSLTGLFLSATYHVAGSTNITGSGKYEKATGYQIDLGYPMKVSDSVKFGPQLTYRNIDLEDGTGGLTNDEIKELTPYFGLWLYF